MAKDPKKPALTTQGEILQEAKDLKKLLEKFPQIGTPKVIAGLEEYGAHVAKAGADLEALSANLAGLREQMEEASKGTTDATAALQGLDLQSELLITRLTGVRKATNATFIEAFGQAWKNTKSLGAALGQMAETAQETLTTFNVGIATVRKFAEGTVLLTMGIDNATAGFAKATGTGNKYKDVIRAAEFRNRRYGISADDAAKATGALVGGFSEFLMMSEDAQKNLTQTVSSFEAIGVNAETTVKFLEAVTRTTGRTAQEAQRLQSSVMATANAFGDDLNAVMSETADILPKLAIHGNNMEHVLNNLYSASKRTGFAMGDIIGMAEQFDTFDAAADAAGNLNAVLGQMGGAPLIDTMQILEETDPAKRMQLFSDAVEQSVGNFEDLGYYQQRAIANAMGLSVEETRRLMLQEEQTSALDSALARQNIGQTAFNELAKEARTIFEELKILAMQFAVSLERPLAALKRIVGGVSTVLDFFGKAPGPLGGVLKFAAGMGMMVGGGAILRGTLGLLTGRGLFKPDGSKRKPFHVIMGAATTLFGGILNKLRARGALGATPPLSQQFGVAGGPAARGGRMLPAGALGTAGTMLAGGAMAGYGGYKAIQSLEKGRSLEETGKTMGWGALTGIGLAVLLAPFTGGTSLLAAGAIGAGVGGAAALAYQEGGIVTEPTMAVIGEGGQNEAVVPLPNGRSIPVDMGGMGDGYGGLNALSAKLDKVIAAIENNVPVLVKGDLEAAGFMQGSRVAVS